jgi:RNA polymerase sigma-70 factor (ECF subfamily)
MTGSAADADDLVQETFVRALERPPPDSTLPWRPWLTRVAMNLARDALRRRRRRGYPGMWLPEPVETAAPEDGQGERVAVLGFEGSPEARYGALESATLAFLLALEVLTPAQRAVLVLRDVLDHSVRETAELLDMSEANVKTTLHRARRAMQQYDERRLRPDAHVFETIRTALSRMLECLATGTPEEVRDLLSVDVRALSDGGGVQFAAARPVVGASKVAKMYSKLASRSSHAARVDVRTVNGLPALLIDDPSARPPNAPRALVFIELDGASRIRSILSLLAPDKLSRVGPLASPA